MDFVGLTIALLLLGILLLIGLARAFQDHSVADLLDWKPTRSPEVEAQNEVDDVAQMIAAQNELRRKRGAKEITEEDVQRQAREDQAFRARGKGPFAQGGGLVDELDEAGAPRRKPKASSRRKPAAKARAGTRSKTAGGKKPAAKPKPRARPKKKS